MSYPPPRYDGEAGEVSAHVVRAGIEHDNTWRK